MLRVADENAVVSNRPFKNGANNGLQGMKDISRSAFDLRASGKLMSSKLQLPHKPRKALGDLTNAMAGTPFASTKPSKPGVKPVSEAAIEQIAGKGWQAMEEDLRLQTEKEGRQRLDRIAASSNTWTTSHLYCEDSSDDDMDSDGSLDERFTETPIIVQLVAPRHAQGVPVPSGCMFDKDVYGMLPELSPAPVDLEFCWTDDDA